MAVVSPRLTSEIPMERAVTFLTVSEKSSGQTLTGLCRFIAEKNAMAKRMLHCDRPCMVTPYLE